MSASESVSARNDRSDPGPVRFMLGDWVVDVPTRRLILGEDAVTLEPLPMALLVELCQRPREVINADALLAACWPGGPMGDNPVHKVVAGLRRALRDSATEPRYIETIRKRGYRLIAPIRVLTEHGLRSHAGGWRGQSPFRGLEPFGAEHASVFFGRSDALRLLHARLSEQWLREHPLVVLLGPSGSGKTSLVQAGLLPAMLQPARTTDADATENGEPLRASTAATVDLAALSNLDPWSALAGALLDWEFNGTVLLAGHSIDTLALALREQCDEVLRLLRIGLQACSLMRGNSPPRTPPVLVLDRLEALFQASAEAEARSFVDCIDRLVRSRLMLVLGVCRNDFYSSLANHPALLHDKEHGAHVDLRPPDAEAIAQMIHLPARAADLIYGTDPSGMNRLEDRLCADAMQAPDALPLLQYTLHELYLNRAPGNELTWDAYVALGRLEGAVGRRAEAVLDGLPEAQQQALADLLPRLMSVPVDDTVPTGRWVAEAELGNGNERALVQAFVDARLLVADRVGNSAGFRVAHEALLRRWPRVTAWVSQHRVSLATREELAPWVRRWIDGGRANALLLPRGATSWQASRALAEAPRLFGDDERDYLARSRARIRRHARLRVAGVTAVAVLAAVTAFAAVGYAKVARLAADRERQSQRLASFMLGDLADQLRPIGKLDLLNSIGEQGLDVIGRSSSRDESPQDALQRAKALVVIGEVNSSRGKARKNIAVPALRQAGELLEPLKHSAAVDPADVYKTLGASAFWLGQIAFDNEDLETAVSEMQRYRAVCEQWLTRAPGDRTAKSELGYALASLGAIAVRRAAWSDARRWIEVSLGIKLALLDQQPGNEELLNAVADSRTWLGVVSRIQGEPLLALQVYDMAWLAQREMAAQHPEAAGRQRDLGILAVRRAEALQALGRPADVVQAMDEAVLQLKLATSKDPSNVRWRIEGWHAQSGLLHAQFRVGMPVAAGLSSLRRSMDVSSPTKATSDPLLQQVLVHLDMLEAELAARERRWPQALTWVSEAEKRLATLPASRSLHWQTRELQAQAGALHMRIQDALGHPEQRRAACVRLADALQEPVRSGQAGLVLETWLVARACTQSASVAEPDLLRLVAGGYRPVSTDLWNRSEALRKVSGRSAPALADHSGGERFTQGQAISSTAGRPQR